MIDAIHFSSACQSWNTPEEILRLVRRVGPIQLDPCSNQGSLVGATAAWELERDGDSLLRPWGGYGLVFVNPPYGRALGPWAEKIATEAALGVEIVTLVPARPGSRWWDTLSRSCALRCLLARRVRFLGAEAAAPFPSAVFYHGLERERFARVFRGVGEVGAVTVKEPVANRLTVTICEVCGRKTKARRATRRTCSDRCRQSGYRARLLARALR